MAAPSAKKAKAHDLDDWAADLLCIPALHEAVANVDDNNPAETQAHIQQLLNKAAENLLLNAELVINGEAHTFEEIEAYFRAPGHDDVFAHCDDFQLEPGRWYFHRMKGSYKGGTYKGLDITFGNRDSKAYGGFLIRSVRGKAPGSELIEGPCCVVDHILAKNGAESIIKFIPAGFGVPRGDVAPPATLPEVHKSLSVRMAATPRKAQIHTGPRVGLTLKKATDTSLHTRFIAEPYRFFTTPSLKKGKPSTICGLHMSGVSVPRIADLTGSPKATIEKYVAAFDGAGKGTDPARYFGADLGSDDTCKLFGACHARTGQKKKAK